MPVRSIILTLLLAAGPASAQEAIPTAARAPEGGAPIAQPSGTLTIPDTRDEFADGPRRVNGCGVPVNRDGKTDKNVHGEVFAADRQPRLPRGRRHRLRAAWRQGLGHDRH